MVHYHYWNNQGIGMKEISLILFYLLVEISARLVERNTSFMTAQDDTVLTTPQLLMKYGYTVESHEVETSDGYLLTLHRIPNKKSNKAPVLVVHGLLCSSADFVVIGSKKALAYLLADEGYDVWLGNARGNVYSRKHRNLDPDEKDFWYFSWHEIGVYDIPAMIDYVLETTSSPSLYHIGHSQGTTSFYVMASERPEYNKKIRLHISLSPVVFMSNLKSPFVKLVSPLGSMFKNIVELFGTFEFMPLSNTLGKITQVACRDQAFTQAVCSNIVFLIVGYDSEQLNTTLLPVILSHLPAGSSTRQLFHYGQLTVSGKFRQYDLGFKNRFVYGQWDPPDYDLKKVTAPVALMYSTNDWLSSVKDVQQLIEILPNVVLKYVVPHPKFNHLDFLYANDVRKLLYNKVVEMLKKF